MQQITDNHETQIHSLLNFEPRNTSRFTSDFDNEDGTLDYQSIRRLTRQAADKGLLKHNSKYQPAEPVEHKTLVKYDASNEQKIRLLSSIRRIMLHHNIPYAKAGEICGVPIGTIANLHFLKTDKMLDCFEKIVDYITNQNQD